MDKREREALAQKLVAAAYLEGDFLLVSGFKLEVLFTRTELEGWLQ